jgi:hypothetical protein
VTLANASMGLEFVAENCLRTFHLNLQAINDPGKYWFLMDYPEYEPLANVGGPVDVDEQTSVDISFPMAPRASAAKSHHHARPSAPGPPWPARSAPAHARDPGSACR